MTDELEEIDGVDPEIADHLRESGFDMLQAIAIATPDELSDIAPMSSSTAATVIEAARDSLNGDKSNSPSVLEKSSQRPRLTTGLSELDELLEGGIEVGTLTEFHGNEDCGRSAIAHQLAVTSQLPTDQGGLDGGCIYIDTRNSFSPEQIQTIVENLPTKVRKGLFKRYNLYPEPENNDDLTERILENIYVIEPETSDSQILETREARELLDDEEAGIQTICVDSVTHLFLEEYTGRSELAERHQRLNKHLHDLQKLADFHNCAVILTNTMTGGGDPAGGEILSHRTSFRVHLKKTAGSVRYADLVEAPDIAVGEADFRLDDGHVVST